MNILFINEKGGYFGGVEQNIALTVKALTDLGHTCHLYYGLKTDKSDEFLNLFSSTTPYKSLIEPNLVDTNIVEMTDTINPDVIYIHKLANLKTLQGINNNYKTIRMIHDHDLCCPRHHKYFLHNNRVCNKPMGWRCYTDLAFLKRKPESLIGFEYESISEKKKELNRHKQLDKLLVGSQFIRNELIMNGIDKNKVFITPPCVQNDHTNINNNITGNEILFVGQLIRGKGVDLLLHALAKIDQEFHCTIIGAGNAKNKLIKLSGQLGLNNKVEFKGWINSESLHEYYKKSRFVVVPSRWPEPFGMVGIEAMQNARPVIGFNVGGISDWLNHNQNGLLVEEQDINGLAFAINKLINNKELAIELGVNAMNSVKENFSFENYINSLIKHMKT
jgi:glycosyltransferase involved in cell wall biosynthesis